MFKYYKFAYLFFLFACIACSSAPIDKNIPVKTLASPVKPEAIVSVAMPFDMSLPIVEIEVNGEPARMVFDTGANRPALYRESFDFLTSEKLNAGREVTGNAFGNNNRTNLTLIDEVTFDWDGMDIPGQAFVVSWRQLGIPVDSLPFFDGLVAPLFLKNSVGEINTVFRIDPKEQSIDIFASASGLIDNNWIRLPLDIGARQLFYTQILSYPVNSKKPRVLNLVVDTGLQGVELILRKGIVETHEADWESERAGLGGMFQTAKVNPVLLNIGGRKFRASTVISESIPHPESVDGVIGYDFLKRFISVFNTNEAYIALKPYGADFSNSDSDKNNRSFTGVPTADWSGFKVIDPKESGSIGLEREDVVISINGRNLSRSYMYSALTLLNKESAVFCWRSQGLQLVKCNSERID